MVCRGYGYRGDDISMEWYGVDGWELKRDYKWNRGRMWSSAKWGEVAIREEVED